MIKLGPLVVNFASNTYGWIIRIALFHNILFDNDKFIYNIYDCSKGEEGSKF